MGFGGDLKIGDMIGGNCSINIHTISQQNGLSLFINSNNSDGSEMNGYLRNCDVSCRNGFIKSRPFANLLNQLPLMILMKMLKMAMWGVGIFL